MERPVRRHGDEYPAREVRAERGGGGIATIAFRGCNGDGFHEIMRSLPSEDTQGVRILIGDDDALTGDGDALPVFREALGAEDGELLPRIRRIWIGGIGADAGPLIGVKDGAIIDSDGFDFLFPGERSELPDKRHGELAPAIAGKPVLPQVALLRAGLSADDSEGGSIGPLIQRDAHRLVFLFAGENGEIAVIERREIRQAEDAQAGLPALRNHGDIGGFPFERKALEDIDIVRSVQAFHGGDDLAMEIEGIETAIAILVGADNEAGGGVRQVDPDRRVIAVVRDRISHHFRLDGCGKAREGQGKEQKGFHERKIHVEMEAGRQRILSAVKTPTPAIGFIAAASLFLVSLSFAEPAVLFNGKDLAGWQTPEDVAWAWSAKGGVIRGISDENAHGKELWSEGQFTDFVLELDWRFPDPPVKKMLKIILPSGLDALNPDGTKKKEEVLFGGDSGILIRGEKMSQINICCKSAGSGELYGYRKKVPGISPEVRAACVPKLRADKPPGEWNHFKITAKGDRISVELNGKLVIDDAQMPGLPEKGPIALQHHGEGIEFRNVTISEIAGGK